MRLVDALRQRWLVLRQLRALPAWAQAVTALTFAVSAVMPATLALATGALVGRLATAGTGPGYQLSAVIPAVGWFVLVLVGEQVLDAAIEPMRYFVGRHLDGAHRRSVERLACAPVGIRHLEDPACQDELRLAAGDPDNWTESTVGQAVWAQLTLLSGYLGGVIALAVIARGSVFLAGLLLLCLMVFRSIQRRGFLTVVRTWVAHHPHRRRAEYWASLLTGPRTAKELRVFGYAGWVLQRYQAESDAYLTPYRAAKATDAHRQWRLLLVAITCMATATYVLGDLAIQGDISIGELSGSLMALALLFPLFTLNPAMVELEGGLPRLLALRRLRTVMAATDPGATSVDHHHASVERTSASGPTAPLVRFESVRFNYPASDRQVLDGLELEIRPGEILALVGLNGAGKTTIIKLLAGLYAPAGGQVTVDGIDLRVLEPRAWRARLAVVFQDFLRYELPARDNIAFGRPGRADDRDVAAAAERAGITDLIEALPSGWDTPLSPAQAGGVDLSGGQWQRIALARALLAVRTGAQILVLDEPTAHLDVRTEFEVFHRVIQAAQAKSVVLISHRLSTVREADRIVLIEDGRVAESGTHDSLLAADGRYARLFQIQARQFTDGTLSLDEALPTYGGAT